MWLHIFKLCLNNIYVHIYRVNYVFHNLHSNLSVMIRTPPIQRYNDFDSSINQQIVETDKTRREFYDVSPAMIDAAKIPVHRY